MNGVYVAICAFVILLGFEIRYRLTMEQLNKLNEGVNMLSEEINSLREAIRAKADNDDKGKDETYRPPQRGGLPI